MAKSRSLQQFAAALREAVKRIPENVNSLKQEVAIAVQDTLIEVTPVKTGKARTNWRVYNEENAGEVLPEPGSPDEGMQAARQQGRQEALKSQAGKPIYLVNKAEYIGRLNAGYSLQAPANYVQTSVIAASSAIAKRKKLILEIK